ncbi:allantoinase, mitochondrial-like [Diadema antillarum]|uniref:allantoinase, mitochondrial-like n=1 Tax=Diadema antillarum TaxID=105358 RepID=UPI003A8B364E
MASIRVRSRRVLLPGGKECPAVVEIKNGVIAAIHRQNLDQVSWDPLTDLDAGEKLVMPGVVDSHVHVNEPGRTQWEGYQTATRAAAAGGVTTIVDMPLNCIPPTTTLEAFHLKMSHAKTSCHVDVAFWGGVVPKNQLELRPMIRAGIAGFKCFLIHSGVDEFPHVTEQDLHQALQQLQGTNSVLLFHAEMELPSESQSGGPEQVDASSDYQDFLASRPKEMENNAIELVAKMCLQYRVPCHIVHLSSADALPIIRDARRRGAPLTVETCHHYLSLNSDDVPQGATHFKCCPPIRQKNNQEVLWQALKDGDIDMVVSDHSPCTPELKVLEEGDFMKAWGGISSLQFGLSLFWTGAKKNGMGLQDMVSLMCERTALLAGLSHQKGALKVGMDGDIVIWDPESTITIQPENVHHRHKVTPYSGFTLQGAVHTTIVRGQVVYQAGSFSEQPKGSLLLCDADQRRGPPRADSHL